MTEVAAGIAAVLLVAVAAFQLALALGAPWGGMAWGGVHEGRLPTRQRAASAVSAGALLIVAGVVLTKAGLVDLVRVPGPWLTVAAWVVVGLLALNTLGNLASRSRVERIVFGTVTAVLVVLCAVVALTGPG